LKLSVAICTAAVGALLLAASQSLPPLRTADVPIRQRVEPYYVENAVDQTATPNLVSAILADYRSFDTFGETTVVFTAGLACYLLLGRRADEGS
jgi:multicomponent Na+:H+ antiporter subunit B